MTLKPADAVSQKRDRLLTKQNPSISNVQRERHYRIFTSVLTVAVSFLLMGAKFWAYQKTESQAVLSDALESLVNVAAAILGVYVIWMADRPADEDHPYGHGKLEYFSAAVEGGLILFAAMMIFGEAVHAIVQGEKPRELGVGILWLGGAGIINCLFGIILIFVGRRLRSIAIKSSGHHLLSDFVTSLIVVGGLILMEWTNFLWLDSVLAIMAAFYLGWTGFRLVHEASGGLLDREDLKVVAELRQVFLRHLRPGIIQLHHVRVIRAGRYHHVDAHMVVPEFWTVEESHQTVQEFEDAVIQDYRQEGEMHVHVDPCERKYCSWCDLPKCPIRQQEFVERHPLSLDELRAPALLNANEPEKI